MLMVDNAVESCCKRKHTHTHTQSYSCLMRPVSRHRIVGQGRLKAGYTFCHSYSGSKIADAQRTTHGGHLVTYREAHKAYTHSTHTHHTAHTLRILQIFQATTCRRQTSGTRLENQITQSSLFIQVNGTDIAPQNRPKPACTQTHTHTHTFENTLTRWPHTIWPKCALG